MSAMLVTLTEAVGGRLSSAAALLATDKRKPGRAATDEGSRAPAELLTLTVNMMRTSGVLVAEGVGVADDVSDGVAVILAVDVDESVGLADWVRLAVDVEEGVGDSEMLVLMVPVGDVV